MRTPNQDKVARPQTHKQMRAACRELQREFICWRRNPGLSQEQRDEARNGVAYIKDMLRAHPLNDDLHRTIEWTTPIAHAFRQTLSTTPSRRSSLK
jgi:hypothetical protein